MRCDLGEGLAQPRRWTRRRRAAMIDSVAEGTSDRNCDVLVHGRRGLDAASARVGSSGTRRRRRRSISRSTDSTCSRPRAHAREPASALPALLAGRGRAPRASLPLRARAVPDPLPALGEPLRPAPRVPQGHRPIPSRDIEIAKERWADFKARMDAEKRVPPRAAGHDAP